MKSIPVIQTNQLTKSFRGVEAVRGLTLSVAPHQITAFLGSNGAGKSTTIKMLLGMAKPTRGEATVLGKRVDHPVESLDLRHHVAYVSEDKRLYGYMTVEQMIQFTSSFYTDWRADVAKALVRRYELPLQRKVRSLSKGMRTKLALLLAFARQPKLLILDEPSEGLDPHGVEELLESLVAHSSEGTSVFFSTHQIEEVERIADHVCILSNGKLVLDSPLDDLRQAYRQINLVFPNLPAKERFQLVGVQSVQTKGHQMAIFTDGSTEAVLEKAQEFHPTAVEVIPVGLRDIFLQTTRGN